MVFTPANKTALSAAVNKWYELANDSSDPNAVTTANSVTEEDYTADPSNVKYYGNPNTWDVTGPEGSRITDMSQLFRDKTQNNHPDISDWDVSQVTDMSFMFRNASTFNQPIGQWNVSYVENMHHTFAYAAAFNQDIGQWNVSRVTDMSFMFQYAAAFNQNISYWNVMVKPSDQWYLYRMFYNSGITNGTYGFSVPTPTYDQFNQIIPETPSIIPETPSIKVFKEYLAGWVNPAINNPSFTQWAAGVGDDVKEKFSFGGKTFTLGENTYTHIFLQTNGWLQLTDASAEGSTDYSPTLTSFLQRPSIAIPWDDYKNGTIYYTPDCIDDQFIIVYETRHFTGSQQVKVTITLNMDSHPSKAGNIELDIGEFGPTVEFGDSLVGVSYGDQSTPTAVSTIDFTDFTNGTEFAYPSIPVDLIESVKANALTLLKIIFERSVVTTIADTTSPVITVTGDNPATVEMGSPYIEVGATASDNVDGDLTSDIVITGTVNTSVVGTYTITYSVTDAAGNTGTATRTVNVVDTTAPIITANLRSTINNGQTSLGSVSANEPVTWSTNNPDIQIDGQGNVSLQQPANYKEKTSYSFTITATDPSNNVKRVNGNVNVYEVFTPETKDELITALNKWYEIANNN